MKNLLFKFFQKNGKHCFFMFFVLEPIFRNNHEAERALYIGIFLVFVFYIIYFFRKFFSNSKNNQWSSYRKSQESLLLDVYICGLGLLGQYLTSPDLPTFFDNSLFWFFFLVLIFIDLIPERKS